MYIAKYIYYLEEGPGWSGLGHMASDQMSNTIVMGLSQIPTSSVQVSRY